jgi:hypothetical protein
VVAILLHLCQTFRAKTDRVSAVVIPQQQVDDDQRQGEEQEVGEALVVVVN